MGSAPALLHVCPLAPHGGAWGSTPQPASAPCPDTLAFMPETLALTLVAVVAMMLLGRLKRRRADE